MAFAKFKELLRRAQARTVDALWELIGRTLTLFTLRMRKLHPPLRVQSALIATRSSRDLFYLWRVNIRINRRSARHPLHGRRSRTHFKRRRACDRRDWRLYRKRCERFSGGPYPARMLLALYFAGRSVALLWLPFTGLSIVELARFGAFYGLDAALTFPALARLMSGNLGNKSIATTMGWMTVAHVAELPSPPPGPEVLAWQPMRSHLRSSAWPACWPRVSWCF